MTNARWALAIISTTHGRCATSHPPRWDAPQYDSVESSHSVAYGRAYGRSARDAYAKALDAEVSAEKGLGTGLTGLGGVAAGLAAFNAHSDALVAAGILGGTAYSIGRWNASRW
jgi:hypothetical protein